MDYNEINCMFEGPSFERVDKITVEAECYNQASAYLQNTLRLFVVVLKAIDPDLPSDALDMLGSAMERPQMVGRWLVKAEVHDAGADIVATMTR